MDKKRAYNVLFIYAFYLALVIFFTTETFFFYLVKGGTPDLLNNFKWNFVRWYPWAFFTPFVFRLLRRFPLEKKNLLRTIPVHIIASLSFSFLQTVILVGYKCIAYSDISFTTETLSYHLVKYAHFNILTYCITISVGYLLDYYRKYRERELHTCRLETQLTQAQLHVLKMQMHPHFLFNTLHAITALVREKPEAAENMISLLSDLLRMSLENSGLHEASLKEELEMLNVYLEIELIRFQDRLVVEMDIYPNSLDALLPNMILQPLVENAIRHGISPRRKGGKVKISSFVKHEKLTVMIEDNGAGFQKKKNNNRGNNGIGLSNTRKRLNQLYGTHHRFDLEEKKEGGVLVTIEIPYKKSSGSKRDKNDPSMKVHLSF